MQVAQAYKRQGDLTRAEHMFREVVRYAPAESNIRGEAQDELEYYLPLIRVQRALMDGNVAAAEKRLLDLQQKFDDRPSRRHEVNRILAGIQASGGDPGDAVQTDSTIDERLVAKKVQGALARYYGRNNRYPPSRTALADALPFDQSPLNAFEVERYSGGEYGYLLVLRSKTHAGQTVTLQSTGLLR